MMTALIWLTVLLKIPIGSLVWMWWVTRPADEHGDEDGGAKVDARPGPRPRPGHPPRPRRGPHTGVAPASPARIRSVIVRSENRRVGAGAGWNRC